MLVKEWLVSSALNLSNLLCGFAEAIDGIKDFRNTTKKISYSVYEICTSAFAMMYFQDPSLDHFQRRMKESMNQSNLGTMFKVDNIPQQKRMRTFIDKVEPKCFIPAFTDPIKRIDKAGLLKQFQFKIKSDEEVRFLCPLDGSQYFHSNNVGCKHCLTKKHRNGTVSYSHSIVLPMIVHPNQKQVLPLIPEEIRNEDGHKKQDCEINAAKRLIPKLKENYPNYRLVIIGDGLYAKQPLIDLISENDYDFMLVVSPDYNVGFLEEVERRRRVGRVQEFKLCKGGKLYHYEWSSEIAFKKTGNTTNANYIGLTIVDLNTGKETYKNTWVTNLSITDEEEVIALVAAARSRWKVENEGFNVLKNHDYEMERNYGHGEENLAFNFFQLTLLAHLYHQAHELGDELYQRLKEKKETKKNFWDSIRSAVRNILFMCWRDLFEYLLDPPEITYDPVSKRLIPSSA